MQGSVLDYPNSILEVRLDAESCVIDIDLFYVVQGSLHVREGAILEVVLVKTTGAWLAADGMLPRFDGQKPNASISSRNRIAHRFWLSSRVHSHLHSVTKIDPHKLSADYGALRNRDSASFLTRILQGFGTVFSEASSASASTTATLAQLQL